MQYARFSEKKKTDYKVTYLFEINCELYIIITITCRIFQFKNKVTYCDTVRIFIGWAKVLTYFTYF